jgi:hypothetical protein
VPVSMSLRKLRGISLKFTGLSVHRFAPHDIERAREILEVFARAAREAAGRLVGAFRRPQSRARTRFTRRSGATVSL